MRLIAVVAVLVGFIAPAGKASAAGPYYPPDPPPQYVESGSGVLAHFPVPGLYMGPTSPGLPPTPTLDFNKLTLDPDLPGLSDPLLGMPTVTGEPDAFFSAGIKDHVGKDGFHPFVGIVTFHPEICTYDPSNGNALIECHTFNLVLYVGVPLPAEPAPTGVATDVLLPVSAGALLLGGGLVVLASPRRRLAPVRVRSPR